MQQNLRTPLPSLSLRPLIVSLMLCLVIAIFAKSQLATVAPQPTSAPDDVFSSERAFNMLQTITREQVPHTVDSPANRVVEQRIVSLLRQMGYQEEIQDTQACADYDRGVARCSKVRNIIVEIAGTDPGNGILLSAHYDSVGAGPGGSDAGAAVGTLLETARLLSLADKPRNSIVLLFNEGEEIGLLGAEAFMKQHPLAKELQLAINVEARGSTGQSVMFETGEDSGWLVQHYTATTKAPLSSSLFYEVYKFLPNDTDLTVYKKNGLQGLNFAHAERLAHYHTPLDNLENLNRGSLQHHGDNVWGVLSSIKDLDLSKVDKGNLVYTDVLGLFVVQWQEATSLIVSIISFALLLLVMVSLLRKKLLKPIQVVKGIFASVLILVISVIAVMGVKWLTQLISSNDYPWYSNTLPMQIAVWSCVAFAGLLIGRLFSKKATHLDALVSVTLIWCLLSIASSTYMAGISFLFIMQASVSLIALFLIAYSQQASLAKHQRAAAQSFILVSAIVVSVIIFTPIAYTLEIMVNYQMAPAIAAVLSFLIMSLLPVLAFNSDANKAFNKLVSALFLVVMVSAVWTGSQDVYTKTFPQHLNLLYLQSADDGSTLVAGEYRNQIPDSLAKALPGETQTTPIAPWSTWNYNTISVDSQKLPFPEIVTTNTTQENDSNAIQLNVTAEQERLRGVTIYVPVDSGLNTIESLNETLNFKGEKTRYNGYYQYRCVGQSCSNTQIKLNFDQKTPSKILVASVYTGLPEAFQHIPSQRGDTAVMAQAGDLSIVYSEVELNREQDE